MDYGMPPEIYFKCVEERKQELRESAEYSNRIEQEKIAKQKRKPFSSERLNAAYVCNSNKYSFDCLNEMFYKCQKVKALAKFIVEITECFSNHNVTVKEKYFEIDKEMKQTNMYDLFRHYVSYYVNKAL